MAARDEVRRVVDPAQLPRRVHRQHRDPDVHRPDAQPRRDDRAHRASARHGVAGDEHLARHARVPARPRPRRRARCVRGVALVRVDLQRGTSVRQRAVHRVVVAQVVGVRRVGHVAPTAPATPRTPRPARRTRRPAGSAPSPAAARPPPSPRRCPPPRGRTPRARGPSRSRCASSSADRPACTETRLSSRPAANSSSAPPSGAGGVRSCTTRSCAATSSDRDPRLGGDELQEPARLAQPPDRQQVLLRVERQALVDRRGPGGWPTAARGAAGGARRPAPTTRRSGRAAPPARGRGPATSSTALRRRPRRPPAATLPRPVSGCGLTFSVGESVCAANTRRGAGSARCHQASSVPSRTSQRPPGSRDQASVSTCSVNPAARSRRTASATAW